MNNGLRLTRDQKSGSGSSAGKTEHVRYDYSYNQGWSGKPHPGQMALEAEPAPCLQAGGWPPPNRTRARSRTSSETLPKQRPYRQLWCERARTSPRSDPRLPHAYHRT